jgi:tetratricopeptide (TPR) repeat protein
MERTSQDQTALNSPSGSTGKEVQIYVLGPMSVIVKGGLDHTPRSRKACALLALLAMAPRGQRTRVWLRDKLWSCSDEKKSSTSLRQIVFELKRDLGDWASQILIIDRQTIGLDLNSVWVDVREIERNPNLFHDLKHTAETQLLEGLDVADEEFEEWLQMERQIWFDRATELAEQSRITPSVAVPTPVKPLRDTRWEQNPVLSLGFLPSIQQGCNEQSQHLADYILEGVANNLRELAPIKIFDFRDAMMGSDFLLNACETEYYARVRILQLRDTISITFFLYQTNSMSLEWSQSIQAPVNEFEMDEQGLVSSFISQTVDRLAKSLFAVAVTPPFELGNVNSVSFTALNMMFQLDDSALENSETLLRTAHETSANPIYPALQSYLLSFKVGENLGDFDQSTVNDVRKQVASMVGANPFNSLALACLGHVIGYVLKDHVVAAELFNRAIQLNPNQAFVWDHYALHKLYTGDCQAAYAASRRAVRLGGYSPIRFSYDTTLCMTSMMSGHLEQAVLSGKSALGKQPRFTAAMRYLAASYGLLDRIEDARGVYRSLLAIDPDFELEDVRKERFRISDQDVEQRVLSAFTNI